MLLKTKMNFFPGAGTPTTEPVVNVDNLRTDGTFTLAVGTAGNLPTGVELPGSVVVSAGGDTQTLTDDAATVSVRNFGLENWGAWA